MIQVVWFLFPMLRYLAEVIGDLAFDDGQNFFVSSLMFPL